MAVDPTRCPDCGAQLTGTTTCAACGLLLRGPLALRLWEVSTELERLTEARAALLRALRPGGIATAPSAPDPVSTWAPAPMPPRGPAAPGVPARPAATTPAGSPAGSSAGSSATATTVAGTTSAATQAAATQAAATQAGAPEASSPWTPPPSAWTPPPGVSTRAGAPRPAPRPRKEWTPQRVQNLLLMTGTLLLVVAAVAFTAFTWGRLPIAARGAIMLALTTVTGWSARWVYRRGLTASAEAIGLLTVLFVAIDAYAAYAANVAGLRGTDPATYASVASGVVAGLAAAFGRLLPVRSVRYAALGAVQLPLAITAFRIDGLTLAGRGAFLAVQAAALGAAAYRLGETAPVVRICALVNWLAAVALATTTAYATTDLGDARLAGLVLAVTGATALLWPGDRTLPAGVVTLFAVAGVVGQARLTLTFVQLPAVVAAAGLVALLAAALVDREWRRGPAAVGAGTVGLALAAVSPWAGQAIVLPLSWLARPWSLAHDEPARTALAADGTVWGGSVVSLAVVVVSAVAAVVAGEAFRRRAAAVWPVVVLGSVAVLLVPLGFAWSLRVALGWYAFAGVAGLAASGVLRRIVVAAPPTIVLTIATAWSFAHEPATLALLLVVTLAYAAYAAVVVPLRDPAAGIAAAGAGGFALALALSRGAPLDRAGFVLAAAAFGLMAGSAVLAGRVRTIEPVAGVAYVVALCLAVDGAGWLAWTLGGGAVTAGLTATRPGRRWLAAPAAVLAAGCSAAAVVAFGLPVEQAAFAVAATACAIVAVGGVGRLRDVEIVGGLTYAAGVAGALPDLTWLSYALGLGALTAGASALRDRVLAPVSAALAIACAGTSAYALGAPLDRTGFVVAVAAALALAAGTALRDRTGIWIEVVAAAGYAAALTCALTGAGWAAWTLGLGALATAAATPFRRPLAGLSALLTALCAAAAGIAFGLPPERTAFVVAATACALAAVASLTRFADVAGVAGFAYVAGAAATAGDLTWLSYTLGMGALTAAAAAVRDREVAPVAAALAVGCAGTWARAIGTPLDRTGMVVALACVLVLAAGVLLPPPPGDQVELVAGGGYVLALALAAPDPGWLSWVLVVGGVTALAGALRRERRWLNWVALVLLTAWAWDRLWLEDVRTPEAYAAPVAAILLTLGYLARRRDDDTGSWRAYGPGLGVAFVPTTYLVLTDPGVTRPVLLAVAGLGVLLAGMRQRLQAPLSIGAGALAVDALVQLAPVAVALPKWATIGAAGLLVIAIGVTYEDRRRDVERLREEFESLT